MVDPTRFFATFSSAIRAALDRSRFSTTSPGITISAMVFRPRPRMPFTAVAFLSVQKLPETLTYRRPGSHARIAGRSLSAACVTMLWPEASPVVNAKRRKSRSPTISGCTSMSLANRLCPATSCASSSWRARMRPAAMWAAAALSAFTTTERVIRSSTTVATMPPSTIRETRAPRPTDGHSGDS